MVKEVKRERVAKNAQTIADVALIDNSEMKPGRLVVGGSQPLSCSAFLGYSSSIPEAYVPEVVQLMWLHIEEPEVTADVLHKDRVWYKICARDVSGGIQVGIPQRNALSLASCSTMEDFVRKHQGNELNMPLLCHARVSRSIRPVNEDASTQGASDLTQGEYSSSKRSLTSESFTSGYVNYTVEEVEPVSWDLASKPNASYNQVLDVLNHCPPHSEGIAFVFLEDVEPDPHYGFRIMYDDLEGMKCAYFAALIGCEHKSVSDQVGSGFRVVTSKVKDVANPSATGDGIYTTVGYCSMGDLAGFRLDPPRGKQMRCALVLCTKKDKEGFHIHKLEIIEPDQVDNAIQCLRKLRTLSKKVQPVPVNKEKRAQAVFLEAAKQAPTPTKKARTLQVAPTDQELEEYHARVVPQD